MKPNHESKSEATFEVEIVCQKYVTKRENQNVLTQ